MSVIVTALLAIFSLLVVQRARAQRLKVRARDSRSSAGPAGRRRTD
jgi:hypothetical protein